MTKLTLKDERDAIQRPSAYQTNAHQPVRVVKILNQRAERPHDHHQHELVIIMSGSGTHVTDTGEWPIRAGDVFVIDPGYHHKYSNVRQLQLVNVLIEPLEDWFHPYDLISEPGWHALFTLEPRLRAQHSFRSRLHLSNDALRRCLEITDEMAYEEKQQGPAWRHALITRFGLLIERLVHAQAKSPSGERQEIMELAQCLAAIERSIDQIWDVDRLCETLHCSPSTLQRLFKRSVGEPPSIWILQRRIHRACQLLRNGNQSITEIAFACGFEDSNYFSRQFKKMVNMSPREYRKRRSL